MEILLCGHPEVKEEEEEGCVTVDACIQTFPATEPITEPWVPRDGIMSPPLSSPQESLGTKIDRFLQSQRKFSDELSFNSPVSGVSTTSLDEIKQVFVDGSNGLVLGDPEKKEDDLKNLPTDQLAEEDPFKDLGAPKSRQSSIMEYFKLEKSSSSRTSSEAAQKKDSAASGDFVSSNGKPAFQETDV